MSQGYRRTLRRAIHADKTMPGCKIVAMKEAKMQVSTCQWGSVHSEGIRELCEEERVKIQSSQCGTTLCSSYFTLSLYSIILKESEWHPVDSCINLICLARTVSLLWCFCQWERIESSALDSRSKVKGVDPTVCSVATKRGLFLWVGAREANKMLQSYSEPARRAVSLAGVPFPLPQVSEITRMILQRPLSGRNTECRRLNVSSKLLISTFLGQIYFGKIPRCPEQAARPDGYKWCLFEWRVAVHV